mgnify:CR=1 FL=1
MAHRAQLFPPDAHKELRRFSSGEVAALLGVKDAYLRKLSLEGRGPQPATGSGGRRLYTSEDIRALRELLEAGTKTPGTYVPGRRKGDHLQVITVINFKGGSGKTTTAAHLAQKCALDGYRVLAIDLDPQASLSALHGFQPEFDLLDGGTLYDAIRYDDPVPLSSIIRKTYFTGLDIVPGNLELMEFEHDTPRALAMRGGNLFFTRIADALEEVEAICTRVIIISQGRVVAGAPSGRVGEHDRSACQALADMGIVHAQHRGIGSPRDFGGNLGGDIKVDGNIGLRYVRTNIRTRGLLGVVQAAPGRLPAAVHQGLRLAERGRDALKVARI